MIDTLPNRVASKIKVDAAGCWLWQGYVTPKGYGRVKWKGKVERVHRLVYETLVGEIPHGLVTDHLCRVRRCCNPAHVEPVTIAENTRRGIPGRYNAKKTHCKRGHEFDAENTYLHRGRRQCRACATIRSLETYRRKLARMEVPR
jgi:hypothetical protein